MAHHLQVNPIRFTADFSSKQYKARRQEDNVFKVCPKQNKQKTLLTKNPVFKKIYFKNKEKHSQLNKTRGYLATMTP